MKVLLIDADYIVYSAGFAVESVSYEVAAALPSGKLATDVVDSLDAADAWQHTRSWPLGTRHLTPVRMVDARPIRDAKMIVSQIFKKIRARASAHFGQPYKEMAFLTGSGNFRLDIATIREYKGNRKVLHKPVHYEALRQYIREKFEAPIVAGAEADDAVSIAAHLYRSEHGPESYLIAAVDKDLWTVPGWHYNFKSDDYSLVSEQEALRNFYIQLLTGDPVDNILGCYGVGATRAHRLLTDGMSEEEMYNVCRNLYDASLEKKGCPYSDAQAALLENARLLHMLRHPRDVWHPPAERHSLVATSSDESLQTLKSGEFHSSTSQSHSRLSSPSLTATASSSATPAGRRSSGKLATRQTSGSQATLTTSKPKGGSRRKNSAGSKRSTSSTSKGTPESGSGSSSCETIG